MDILIPKFIHRTIFESNIDFINIPIESDSEKLNDGFISHVTARLEQYSKQSDIDLTVSDDYSVNDKFSSGFAEKFCIEQQLYELQLMTTNHISNQKYFYLHNKIDKLNDIKYNKVVKSYGVFDSINLFSKCIIDNLKFESKTNLQVSGISDLKFYNILTDFQNLSKDFILNYVSPNIVPQKVFIISNSEIIIRDFFDESSNLIEEIKRQMPDNIVKIWLNGKVVWNKK